MDPTTFRLMSGATAPPVEITFTANNYNLSQNQTSTLSWSVLNSTSVSISYIGSVEASGSTQQSGIGVTRTYTLTAIGLNGITYTSSITITWSIDPVTITFTSDNYDPGMNVGIVLTWSVLNSTSVSISYIGSVEAAGSIAVSSPAGATPLTRTYTLTAVDALGTSFSSSLTVNFRETCAGRVWRDRCLV